MTKKQKEALINLMIVTDKYNLLKDSDQHPKEYEQDKENAYHWLVSMVMEKK